MVKSLLLSGVLGLGLLAGCQNQQVSRGGADASSQGDLCMADTGGSRVISDLIMDQRFTKQLGLLIDRKQTVSAIKLSKQLPAAKSCTLKLPKVKTQPLSNMDLYEQYMDSVLMVGKSFRCGNPRCAKNHTSIASGFLLGNSGAFVTSYHVVNGAMGGRAKTMVVMNGKGKMWAVSKVLAADKVNDFAILQLKGKGFKGLPIRGDIRVGEKIRTLTHPTGHFFTMSEGIVTRKFFMRLRGFMGKDAWLNIDADFCKGSSGGPIIDRFGNVVGIVASTQSVYYTEDRRKKVQQNLQMVFKNVSAAENFLKRIKQK